MDQPDLWPGPPLLHGTPAELVPGDLIEPGKYPPSHPESDNQGPRQYVYLSSRRAYLTEHYGPNLYEVKPTGPVTRDPEYSNRRMLRSKYPLRVVRKVSRNWGEIIPETSGALCKH